jgi:ribosomal protein S8
MSTDSVADMLTRIRNANSAGHPRVAMPASRMGVEIARVLKDEGYIAGYEVAGGDLGQKIDITFKGKSTRPSRDCGASASPAYGSTRARPRSPGCSAAWAS